jgi:hypothetical protein
MSAGETTLVAWPRVRWFHWVLLVLILGVGTGVRWDCIGKENLWLDEYWALYLSTGRGGQLFGEPRDVVIDPPPKVGFADAPAWWHIWNGLGTVTHPPLYFLSLRGWVDLFGESDRAIRSMSAIFSLAGIVVLFSLVRRIRGPGAGLIASAMMAVSPMQIDYSQMTRPYTLLVLVSLLCCHALISMQFRGSTPRRRLLLGAAILAMALTHYFSLGAILAVLAYAVIALKGRVRKDALVSIGAGLLLAGLVWGPFLWKIRGSFNAYPDFARPSGNRVELITRAIVTAPAQVLLEPEGPWTNLECLPLALLAYVVPLLLAIRSREMLLWWLWIVGTIGMLVVVDLFRGTVLVGEIRYSFILSPVIFIVLVTLLPEGWPGNLVSPVFLSCVAIYGWGRFEAGPWPTPEWRNLIRFTNQFVGPRDLVAFCGAYSTEPVFDYFVMTHYMGPWSRPVIFLKDGPDAAVRRQLAARGRIWIIGHDLASDSARFFPGWTGYEWHGVGIGNSLLGLKPLASATQK